MTNTTTGKSTGNANGKISQWQPAFSWRDLRRHGLENLVVTVKIEGRRAKDIRN